MLVLGCVFITKQTMTGWLRCEQWKKEMSEPFIFKALNTHTHTKVFSLSLPELFSSPSSLFIWFLYQIQKLSHTVIVFSTCLLPVMCDQKNIQLCSEVKRISDNNITTAWVCRVWAQSSPQCYVEWYVWSYTNMKKQIYAKCKKKKRLGQ